jgi:hypothetical protein
VKTKSSFNLLLLIAIVLLIYNIIKAIQVPFYWDEIYTYLRYVKPGIFILNEYDRMDANHHLLNTWLIQCFIKLFGLHEFVLRLPNILSFVVYASFAVRFSTQFQSYVFQIGCFIILLLNPFVNDYFCLARGYGISMALMLGSLFFVHMFIRENYEKKFAFLSLLFASIALLANFSLINYVLILLFIYVVFVLSNLKVHFKKPSEFYQFLLSLIVPIAILLFTTPIILKLKKAGALFIGKNNGFWQDTMLSLIQRFLYQPKEMFWMNLSIKIGLLFILSIGIIVLINTIKNKAFNTYMKFQVGLMLIFLFCVLANIFQNKFMDVLYGIGRTAMYYYPLISLASIFIIYNLSKIKPTIARFILAFIVLFFSLNYTYNLNTHYAIEWQAEGDAKLMVEDLRQFYLKEKNRTDEIIVGMTFPYHDDLTFYKEIHHLNWLNYVQDELAFNALNDFFFIELKDTVNLKGTPFRVIVKYKASNAALIENLQTWKVKTAFSDSIDFNVNAENVFSNAGLNGARIDSLNCYSKAITFDVNDSILKAPSKIYIDGNIYGDLKNDAAKIVLSFERNGQAYKWQAWPVNNFLYEKNKWNKFKISAHGSANFKLGDVIKCYIWNTHSSPTYINTLTCKLNLFYSAKVN